MRVLPLGKGEHHEGRSEQNFRQEIYAGQIPRERNDTNCFAWRRDLKAGALCEFAKQGEHGEAGSRAARVNEPTCDRIHRKKFEPRLGEVNFLWESNTNCFVLR